MGKIKRSSKLIRLSNKFRDDVESLYKNWSQEENKAIVLVTMDKDCDEAVTVALGDPDNLALAFFYILRKPAYKEIRHRLTKVLATMMKEELSEN